MRKNNVKGQLRTAGGGGGERNLQPKEVDAIAKEIERLDTREKQLNERDAVLSMKQQELDVMARHLKSQSRRASAPDINGNGIGSSATLSERLRLAEKELQKLRKEKGSSSPSCSAGNDGAKSIQKAKMDFELMQARAFHAECELEELKKRTQEKEGAASSTNKFLASKLEKAEKELKERVSELALSAKAGAEARENVGRLRERVSGLELEVADSALLRQEVANVRSEMDKRCKAWDNRFATESKSWAKEKESLLAMKNGLKEELLTQQTAWEKAHAKEREERRVLKAKLQESHLELERLGREFAVVLEELTSTRTINQNTFERLEVMKDELKTAQDKLQELLFAMQNSTSLKLEVQSLEKEKENIVDHAKKTENELESRLRTVTQERDKLKGELEEWQQKQNHAQEEWLETKEGWESKFRLLAQEKDHLVFQMEKWEKEKKNDPSSDFLALQGVLTKIEKEREDLRSSNRLLQEKFDMALQVENNLSKRVEELASEKDALRDRIRDLENDVKAEQEDALSFKSQMQSFKQLLDSSSQRISLLDKEKLEGSREKLQAELEKSIAEEEALKAKHAISSLQEKILQSEEKEGSLMVLLEKKNVQIREFGETLKGQYSINQDLQDKIRAANMGVEVLREAQAKARLQDDKKEELDALRIIHEEIKLKCDQASDENRLLKQSLKLKSDIQKRMTSEFEVERQQLNSQITDTNEVMRTREVDIENLSARLISLIESGEKHVNDVEDWKRKVEEMRVESLRKDQIARERVAMMEETYKKYLSKKK